MPTSSLPTARGRRSSPPETVCRSANGGHRIRHVQIGGDTRGIQMARRDAPGYLLPNGHGDPWIRIDGHAMFRFATESFSTLIRDAVAKSGWQPDDTRWVIPHQANGRILKAAAKRSGIPFDRFFINIENIGNTSSASIPLGADRRAAKPAAGRQARALQRRRGSDDRGDFGRVVITSTGFYPASGSLSPR